MLVLNSGFGWKHEKLSGFSGFHSEVAHILHTKIYSMCIIYQVCVCASKKGMYGKVCFFK